MHRSIEIVILPINPKIDSDSYHDFGSLLRIPPFRHAICEFSFIEKSRCSITDQKVKVEYGTTDNV
jgi:hypothetical protein